MYLLCRISFQGPWERVNPWLSQGITVGISGSIWDPFRVHSDSIRDFRFHSGSIWNPFRFHSGFQVSFWFHSGSIHDFRVRSGSIWDPFRFIQDFRVHSGSIQGPCCLSLTVPPTYRTVWEQVSNFFNLSIYIYIYIYYVESASRVRGRESTLDSPRELL